MLIVRRWGYVDARVYGSGVVLAKAKGVGGGEVHEVQAGSRGDGLAEREWVFRKGLWFDICK
jgi:hypothetical protein